MTHRLLVAFYTGTARLAVSVAAGADASSVVDTPQTPIVAQMKEDADLVLGDAHQDYTAPPGATKHRFVFHVSNVSAERTLLITQVRTSCGCSVASIPTQPWRLAPGERGEFSIEIDFAGKTGTLQKSATIETDRGTKLLSFQVTLPTIRLSSGGDDRRANNQQLAAANRQAVFAGDCARCHAAPTAGLHGKALYDAACGVCHEAEHRATMVPDLRALNISPTSDYWRALVVAGKPGTLMPGFSSDMGGPLTKTQIDTLVDYLTRIFPRESARKAGPAHPAGSLQSP